MRSLRPRTLPLYLQASTIVTRDVEAVSGTCGPGSSAGETWLVPVRIPARGQVWGREGVAKGKVLDRRARIIDGKLDYAACHFIMDEADGTKCSRQESRGYKLSHFFVSPLGACTTQRTNFQVGQPSQCPKSGSFLSVHHSRDTLGLSDD